MNNRKMALRFVLSAVLFMLTMLGLGCRLAFLHLGPHAEYRDSIERRRQFEKEITVRRGNICDREGRHNILALDLAVKDVCADPTVVAKKDAVLEVATRLSEHLELPIDEVAVKLNRPKRLFSRIKRFVPADLAAAIEMEKLPGVFFRDANVRYYPHHSFMCHVLGFVNHQGLGSAGVEQRMHKHLKGSPGVLEGQVDALRHELYLQRGRHIPGMEGSDVQLTLDQNVQHIVEKELDGLMEEYKAKGAWCIVQRVRTGEILAMASRPAYDLNDFGTASDDLRLNRAIGSVYEPGSTMKAALFAAALNERIITPDDVYSCENGIWYYKRRPLRDSHPYGDLTVEDGLKKSSNIMTAKISLELGNERLHRYLSAFGIGKRLGVDLPGEEAGIFAPTSRWSSISPTRIPIGQGVAVTALQMLGVYCTIANDGYLMRPHVIKRVTAADGTVVYEAEPQVLARVIRPDTAATMRRMLVRVTEDGGTGRRARVDGFSVAGKTGTAQKAIPGGYSDTDYVASFVGFLPAENPDLAIIVSVDEPQKYHGGGRVAAPAFSSIATEVVCCLGIQPTGGIPVGARYDHRL
ncbi:MAG: penicillin-binding protein 2 [Verrucomicrobia bacterium]|jgi:cell division protein FtsI (penicillin-binding protein 3)|nr:penicillin-binding protein 2 [Verrucomicrobiota bacterium]